LAACNGTAWPHDAPLRRQRSDAALAPDAASDGASAKRRRSKKRSASAPPQRAQATRGRAVVYVAVGADALRSAFRSARSARAADAGLATLVVTDVPGKRSADAAQRLENAAPLFDHVVSVGQSSAHLRPSAAARRRLSAAAPTDDGADDKSSRRRQGLSPQRLQILTARSLLLGLELYETVLSLDAHTAVCGPLDAIFDALQKPDESGGLPDVVFARAAGEPSGDAAVLAVRNSTEARELLLDWHGGSRAPAGTPLWHGASRAPARATARAADRRSFRAALAKSQAVSVQLDETYDCRASTPLACGLATTARGKTCAVVHARAVSAQPAAGPGGLPNFYLRTALSDGVYHTAPSVFMHIPKAAGNSVKELFVKGFLKESRAGERHAVRAQSLHIDSRRAWDQRASAKRAASLFYGAFGFGACSRLALAPCAYYVVLRHPVSRVVSEFEYCHSVQFEDQCCTGRIGAAAMNKKPDVAAWAEERGNFMLEHFLGLSDLDWADVSNNAVGEAFVPWHDRDASRRINPIETRRLREGAANAADLQLVLSHLEDWIAVIGITERFEESMALFSLALAGKPMPKHRAASVHTHNANTSTDALPPTTRRRIEAAVALDLQLYDAARNIFQKQLDAFKSR